MFSILFFFRNLSSVQDREICCYSISCKEKQNIGKVFARLNSGPNAAFSQSFRTHMLLRIHIDNT